MKINAQATAPRSATIGEGRVQGSADRTKGPAAAAGVAPSTQVKLSAGADLKAAGSDGDFDAQRVESLKAAIAGGTFKVNPEVVADKLIASNVDALTSTPRN
jgi:negative regulator of flagellin synthesis FlgM